ncbi:MAG: VWA domain-containing protein [Myxococcota bacterium]|nr:VWA domain-containing protein [Myxococcota bacterium]
MSFLTPAALWLLLPILLSAALMMRQRPGPGVLTRAFVLVLLTLALADPVLTRENADETVVFVIDTSDSIPEAEQARAAAEALQQREALTQGTAGLITFAEQPIIQAIPGQPWPEMTPSLGSRSDLDAALRMALSLIPEQSSGRIVLFTDGHTDTDPVAALAAATERRISLTPIPLHPEQLRATITEIHLDSALLSPGETLSGHLTLSGGATGWSGDLDVSVGGRALDQLPAEAAAESKQTLAFTLSLPSDLTAGPTLLSVSAAGVETSAALTIQPAPRIWIITDRARAGANLAALLTADGLAPERISPGAIPDDLAAELIVLADVTSASLPRDLDDKLARFVSEGGSLLTLGGDASYDLGGWHTRPLADLLPVRMDPDGALKDDAITLVIALDKSGSMAQSATTSTTEAQMLKAVGNRMVGGRPRGSKIRLAAEGSVSALKLLRDTDFIGVLSIDTQARWPVAVQSVTQRDAVIERIRSISSGGGGIYTITALEAARDALRASDTPLRHLIFFADTADAGEQVRGSLSATELVSDLAQSGITLSVIGIGSRSAQDAEFLIELARLGGGRFHATDDPEDLPALFAQETEELLGAALEESADLTVMQTQWHPALTDIAIEDAPALTGYNRVLPQPAARTILTTAGGVPLLSTWRVGLGEVTSISTDDGGRWAASWRRWEGGGKFWVQLIRGMLDGSTADTTITIDAAGTVTVSRYDTDGLSLPRPAVFAAPDDSPAPLPLTAATPGTWQGQLALDGQTWSVAALDSSGELLARQQWSAPPSREHVHQAPDDVQLAQLRLAPQPQIIKNNVDHRLWPWLLLISALLLPIDAFARRQTHTVFSR